MNARNLRRFSSIAEFHQLRGLPKPEHPLVSVINLEDIKDHAGGTPLNLVFDFYSIALKRNFANTFRYGQQEYDFGEGAMFFMAPGQVFGIDSDPPGAPETAAPSGWMLSIHPDFLWNTSLATTIQRYEFFDYAAHEALFLSDKEEGMVNGIIRNIQQEYHANIDTFSQGIIVSQIEVLLNYADRFYHRQFITRKISHSKVLSRLEALLVDYFNGDALVQNGLPTVQYLAESLHVSPSYLSSMLKVQTGQSTQQHIHNKLLSLAKTKLSTTDLRINEIAYELGFEHSQSFSKFFKNKTKVSPLEFRRSFLGRGDEARLGETRL